MNTKNRTSFIEIVKRIKKDQLIVLLLLGVLLLVIAMPAEGLSVAIHSSIDGIVDKINEREIVIKSVG